MGRAPGAVATVIDSQSVKAAEAVGKDSRGYDGAKKNNGRKRHLVVDTKGLPLFVLVTPADMTDRDAAKEVLFRLRLMHPEITIVWADSGSAGQLVTWAKKHLNLTLKTVSRPPNTPGFVILPRRCVVERSLAWIMHAHRRFGDRPGTRFAVADVTALDDLEPFEQYLLKASATGFSTHRVLDWTTPVSTEQPTGAPYSPTPRPPAQAPDALPSVARPHNAHRPQLGRGHQHPPSP